MRPTVAAVMAGVLCGAGCAPANTTDRVAALETELARLKTTLEDMRTAAEKEQAAIAQFMDAGEVVTLKPTDSGYVALWHDLGVFAVEFADVTPDASGSIVRLRLGNVTAAAVNNVEATVAWGRDGEVAASVPSKRVALGRTFPPNAWTDVAVVLEGISPRDLGFVRLSEVAVGSVSLRRPNRP